MDLQEAVITTRYVLEQKSKVVYVHHAREGWQFYGEEKEISEEDARVISLSNLLRLNPHVEKILWIPEGMEAWINDENSDWQTGVANPE